MQIQIDAACVDLTEEGDEVLEGSSEAIYRPAGDEVDLPSRHHRHQPVVAGALVTSFGPRDAFIAKDLDDLPSEPLTDDEQFPALVLDGLRVRAHTEIQGYALGHSKSVSQFWKASSSSFSSVILRVADEMRGMRQ